MEPVIWAYAYGKPKERISLCVEVSEDLAGLTMQELLSRADELRQELLEAAAVEATLEAQFRIEDEPEP